MHNTMRHNATKMTLLGQFLRVPRNFKVVQGNRMIRSFCNIDEIGCGYYTLEIDLVNSESGGCETYIVENSCIVWCIMGMATPMWYIDLVLLILSEIRCEFIHMGTVLTVLFAKYMSINSKVNTGRFCLKNNSWQTVSYGCDDLRTIYILYIYILYMYIYVYACMHACMHACIHTYLLV